ncbi:phosphatidylserine decarboxylase [Clostridium ganghwense]|uniref:Phosphatidylserine decarboxylase proenzyme n=1 Tax=Clostridium ganghwense TaxID=312089 RepID=A0ABT4CXU4_9CLOT|nr:phosphatidylserine decarboxylase [Clostridium ganghwense]MCY6372704.1 phosphatidylserine decarboxylase [Clostridium ganghwense]
MIKYFNREANSYEIEKVAGDKYLKWTYSSPIGMKLLELLIKKKFFSKYYGWYCDTGFSKGKIQKFIDNFDIDEKEFKKLKSNYKCFNDFFTRELVTEARPINYDKSVLISPGDGRVLAYENIDINKLIQVKGFTYKLTDLLQNLELAEKYSKGSCIILRLCPTDYHRFHFIDNGICDETIKINGSYYSVNPIALEKIPKLFCENKREYSIFHSENFGDVIFVDVGATCVGSIIQTYAPCKKVKKGDEKGYFKFGGSTTILFFEKDKIKIDSDIIEQTNTGFETKVCMGEKIGLRL